MYLDQSAKSQLHSPVLKTEDDYHIDFETIVRKAPVGICKISLNGIILFVNEKFCRLLKISPKNAINKNFLDFYKSETNTGHLYWLKLMQSGNLTFYNGRVELTAQNGDIVPCHLNMQHLCSTNVKPAEFLCIIARFEEEKRISHQQNLSGAIIRAQEKERAFLAEELHDNINQLLATTKLYIDSAKCADAPQSKELLEKSSEHVMMVINEIRALSKSLTPPAINHASLMDNITALFSDAEKLSGICVEINHNGFDDNSICNEKKLVIYRIVQEQFNNILKHANANKIKFSIKNKNKFIAIIMEDNGVGFDTGNVQMGMGLRNIQNRAILFNGRTSVQSTPGKGCRLYVEIEA